MDLDAFFGWLLQYPVASYALTGFLIVLSVLLVMAFRQGRSIEFWPPKIGPKPAETGKGEERADAGMAARGPEDADFPFVKYRVKHVQDGRSLLAGIDITNGTALGEAWQFAAAMDGWAVYGPYLRESLPKGKYRASFRIKVNKVSLLDVPIIEVDVASHVEADAEKILARRGISTHDFERADEYRDFELDFEVLGHERKLELRVRSKASGHLVTLDYVELLPL